MGTGRRTGEKPVLASNNEWPDGVLSRIVVWSVTDDLKLMYFWRPENASIPPIFFPENF